jgi:hypothetical protein
LSRVTTAARANMNWRKIRENINSLKYGFRRISALEVTRLAPKNYGHKK